MHELGQGIRKRLDRPVVLVGMMGCGKSHIGSLLAKELGVEFVDSDQKIEEAAGYEISRIFELDGEDKFRKLEARIVKELCQQGRGVIATGGGAILKAETRKVIKDKTISIWLDDDIALLSARIKKSTNRPLLACGNVRKTLENLLEERQVYYAGADIIVKSSQDGIRKKLSATLNSLNNFLA